MAAGGKNLGELEERGRIAVPYYKEEGNTKGKWSLAHKDTQSLLSFGKLIFQNFRVMMPNLQRYNAECILFCTNIQLKN